jgi:hypothetical protein
LLKEPDCASAIQTFWNASASGYVKPDVVIPNATAGMNAKSISGMETRLSSEIG